MPLVATVMPRTRPRCALRLRKIRRPRPASRKHCILAQRVDEQARTSGGLFIPDNAKEKPLEAVVIAVGSGKLLKNGTRQPIAEHSTINADRAPA